MKIVKIYDININTTTGKFEFNKIEKNYRAKNFFFFYCKLCKEKLGKKFFHLLNPFVRCTLKCDFCSVIFVTKLDRELFSLRYRSINSRLPTLRVNYYGHHIES